MDKKQEKGLTKTIERYRKDPEFHAIVDLLCQTITKGHFTFKELSNAMALVELFDKRRREDITEHIKEE